MTITDNEIRRLRRESAHAGDIAQVVICDLALGELNDHRSDYPPEDGDVGNMRIVADYYAAILPHETKHLRELGLDAWCPDRARRECVRVRVLADASAQACDACGKSDCAQMRQPSLVPCR